MYMCAILSAITTGFVGLVVHREIFVGWLVFVACGFGLGSSQNENCIDELSCWTTFYSQNLNKKVFFRLLGL
jgi:hypothetical protein